MEAKEIIDAITATPTLVTPEVLTALATTEAGKKFIDARADVLYKANIGTEVQKIYSQIDDDIFAIIGERPTGDGDKKEKTYDFVKRKVNDLKRLLAMEATLNADDRIKQLNADLEKLKGEGAAKWTKEQWDAAADNWAKEKQELEDKLKGLETSTADSQKKAEIASGLSTLQFNPDISETIKKMVLGTTESELLKNSKIEDGKVVFLNADGKPIMNATQTGPATAAEVLAGIDGIKEITTTTKPAGGGAPTVIVGKVINKTDDKGNAVKTLDLGPKGTFTTKVGFITAFEREMAAAGIAKGDPDYSTMEAEAYKSHDVSTLPAE